MWRGGEGGCAPEVAAAHTERMRKLAKVAENAKPNPPQLKLDANAWIFTAQAAKIRVNPSPTSERCNGRPRSEFVCVFVWFVTQAKTAKSLQQNKSSINLKKTCLCNFVARPTLMCADPT